jgi:hypothetical protein
LIYKASVNSRDAVFHLPKERLMDLAITGVLAKQLLSMSKKDPQLAQALALQYLDSIDKVSMARYLLSGEIALKLLVERFALNPEKTVRDLQALPERKPGARRGRKPKALEIVKAEPVAKRGRRGRRRHRLSADQVEGIKAQVITFLKRQPWSTRKAISKAVDFPSLALYNRIIGELKNSGEVIQKGQKAKALYALDGRRSRKVASAKPVLRKKKATNGRRKRGKKSAAIKLVVKKRRSSKRTPLLCPVPGCTNKAAPIFGMVCKDHKDLPKAERDALFAARREMN